MLRKTIYIGITLGIILTVLYITLTVLTFETVRCAQDDRWAIIQCDSITGGFSLQAMLQNIATIVIVVLLGWTFLQTVITHSPSGAISGFIALLFILSMGVIALIIHGDVHPYDDWGIWHFLAAPTGALGGSFVVIVYYFGAIMGIILASAMGIAVRRLLNEVLKSLHK